MIYFTGGMCRMVWFVAKSWRRFNHFSHMSGGKVERPRVALHPQLHMAFGGVL